VARRRAFVVVNPVAGGGRTRRLWPAVRDGLARAGLDFDFAETRKPGEALLLARHAAADWPVVVAVGGDGTVNEVANGLVPVDGEARACLGVIPTGRACDTCRVLGVPHDHRAAIARLVAGTEARRDLGVIRPDVGLGGIFVGVAGAGFDAIIAARTARSGGGRWSYLGAALGALREHRPAELGVVVDGRRVWSGRATTVVAANGPCFGGGMKIAPRADGADGVLDVVIVGDLGRAELVAWLPTIYAGWHVRNRHVTIRRETSIRVQADALPVHVDGEPAGLTPVTMAVRPGALRVMR
jgi:YegS/Rv2252/BmrU family lipid kinase